MARPIRARNIKAVALKSLAVEPAQAYNKLAGKEPAVTASKDFVNGSLETPAMMTVVSANIGSGLVITSADVPHLRRTRVPRLSSCFAMDL